MKKFSIVIAGRHATSISLEDEFYQAFQELAKEKKLTLNELATQIDKERVTTNLSSAIRLYILKSLQEKISQA